MARLETVFVGTFTRPEPYLANTNGEGVYVLDFDLDTGSLYRKDLISGLENPGFLAVAPDGRSVHAVWEVPSWPEGIVSSFSLDDGKATYRGVQGTRGVGPAHITTDSQGRYCFIANYATGEVAMLPLRSGGSIGEAVSVVVHEGSGPDTNRQEGPHPHSMVLSPDDRYVLSADLGSDKVLTYQVDYENGFLIPWGSVDVPPGSGPRHISFHPTGEFAYVNYELTSKIAVLSYRDGKLDLIEEHSTLPDDFDGHSEVADLHVHPSGNWVYVSNRGHDSIAVFTIETGGKLTAQGQRTSEGKTPRNFAISPDGDHLLVANQDSDNIVVMAIDPKSGFPEETVTIAEVPTPVCVKFVP